MKKLFVTMLTILTSGAAFALPVGNPSDASLLCDGICWEGHCGDMCDPCLTWCDAFSVRVGFYGDYVYNRHLETNDTDPDKDIDHSQIFTNAAFLAGNFWDRFDIFATLGVSKFYLEGNRRSFTEDVVARGLYEVESNSEFSWSIGARGSLWECGCTTLGAEFQYFQSRPHITRIVDFRGSGDATSGGHLINPTSIVGSKYYEWQFGLGISHRINFLVPYAAVKWSGARLHLGEARGLFGNAGTATLLDLKNDKLWGYAIGVSLVDCEKMSLTVEGRYADETALYVNGQIRF